MNLTSLDFAVIAIPLVFVIGMAVYLQRYMRSVADFLAANRCAGRFLIATSMDVSTSSAVTTLITMEVFSKAGFSLIYWMNLTAVILFFMGILGLVSYRYRETRVLTFHQFFEVRYSKGIRVFASFLNIFSGIFNFGLGPALGARFFVYFCGMPESLDLGGFIVPTFLPVMLILMGASLFFVLSGGQITVMVTDCLEGVISTVLYLFVTGFLIFSLTSNQVKEALLSGPPGGSFVDPFDIGSRPDFNIWYVVLYLVLNIYFYRGNAWNAGFAASAKSAHELRMAQILGNWRTMSYGQLGVLVSIAAFTVLHHADFASQRDVINQNLQHISLASLQDQMRLPMALSVLLPPGIKGAFCAVLLFGLVAAQSSGMHNYGATILQDVILPLKKKPFTPKGHIRCLRLTITGIAIFACTFSYFFKPVEYLIMIIGLIGAIYLGGIGLVVWGGLYWKKGTAAGAWASMSLGATLGITFNLMQQFWVSLHPWFLSCFGTAGALGRFLAEHPNQSPFNGQQLSAVTALVAGSVYIIVSLLTCRENFNLDAMLHRGKYRIATENEPLESVKKQTWYQKLLNIDEHFNKSDKALAVATVIWTLSWKAIALGIMIWTLVIGRLSPNWWFHYSMFTGVWLTLVLGCVTMVWFIFGVSRDLKALIVMLRNAKRNDADDGTVQAKPDASSGEHQSVHH